MSGINTTGSGLPPEETARLAAVRRYRVLDTGPDQAFGRVAGLAARTLAAPVATVSFVDAERIWFKARRGLDREQAPRAPGLAASAILHDGAHVVADATADPGARANPLVTELGVRFYAGWPIVTADGQRLGAVDVMDFRPRQAGQDELRALADLAAMVADELELRLSAGRTVEAERALRTQIEREKTLVEQIAALEAERTSQLEHALEHRVLVEQAKGVLMGREGLSVDEAFQRLRAVARSRRRPVEELAREVVAGRPLPPVAYSNRPRTRGGSGGSRDRQPRRLRAGAGPTASRFTDEGLWITRRRSPYGLRVRGEVDRSNIDTLAAALAAVIPTSQDLHLDLAGLEFIDVAGIRLLVEQSGRMPPGRYLVLDGVAPYLRRILALVGWDRTPGLKIGGDQP
ncbi:MAG TPA: ANTAR domain-containing protein [Actinomycetota bacterium]|nr:ANTAR domain-containing protein [Actinomycetota bacterium]